MSWQQILGVVLGLFFVGPTLAGLALGGGAGPIELLLSSIVSAIAGYIVAGKAGARPC